jgi:hypothetical protein
VSTSSRWTTTRCSRRGECSPSSPTTGATGRAHGAHWRRLSPRWDWTPWRRMRRGRTRSLGLQRLLRFLPCPLLLRLRARPAVASSRTAA